MDPVPEGITDFTLIINAQIVKTNQGAQVIKVPKKTYETLTSRSHTRSAGSKDEAAAPSKGWQNMWGALRKCNNYRYSLTAIQDT